MLFLYKKETVSSSEMKPLTFHERSYVWHLIFMHPNFYRALFPRHQILAIFF